MSVCINAVASDGAVLVIGSDMMVSLFGGMFSADSTTNKAGNIVPKRWGALYAGDDITHILPVIKAAREELSGNPRPTQARVAAALKRSYQAARAALAVDKHLSIYQIGMDQFLSTGLDMFGEVGYGVLRERIDKTTLDCSLLVGGFDENDRACIFVLDEPGTVHDFNGIGYWAIGSGAPNALGRMSIRRQHSGASITDTIYNVCEAKAAAESAFGVGKSMNMFIVTATGAAITIGEDLMREVVESCRRNLCPAVDQKLLERIEAKAWSAYQSITAVEKLVPPKTKRGRKALPPSPE